MARQDSRPDRTSARTLLVLICVAWLGAGCGIKGPLTLPKTSKEAAPASSPADAAAAPDGEKQPAERKP